MLTTHTHFLKRLPLYYEEKPYSLRYTPPAGFPRANIEVERRDIQVEDIRPHVASLTLAQDGCELLPIVSRMRYADFDNDETIKAVYLREVADELCRRLGAQRVQVFEHTVRRRHAEFPISTGEAYQWNQPTSIAHVDTTLPWALDMARKLNPGNEAILQHRIQCVNIWKPLQGPVRDWPLALCHPSSVNSKIDFEPCDLVYPDYVVENRQVYHSERLRWMYLKDQGPDEAWVFSQADSMSGTVTNVAHTACPISDSTTHDTAEPVRPRESIEVRALVLYGGFGSNDEVGKQ
ncbi:hypothetical protein N0V93_009833 [Gnomoniopsis smithogilvyi]|uniref:Methyltransferase n=1 Tax=Gnomoniopsis smithogilvyi TaxID=1191159 RepID=A0A9W9CSQ2_9PEZI|nr:hypothetical protein N0V93_009833 [Gnomoniopsis smithogilvyi]